MGSYGLPCQTTVTPGWHIGCQAAGSIRLMVMVTSDSRKGRLAHRLGVKIQADCCGLILRKDPAGFLEEAAFDPGIEDSVVSGSGLGLKAEEHCWQNLERGKWSERVRWDHPSG